MMNTTNKPAVDTKGRGRLRLMRQTIDELYQEIKSFVRESKKCSASLIMKNFGLGFLLTYRLIKRLEEDGVVSKFDDMDRERKVLIVKQLSLFD